MIPTLKLRERILAWLLWHLEARHGFGGGFDVPIDGARWQFSKPERASLLYTYALLNDYYMIKASRLFREK
ncbi:hypothetical protein Ccur_02870 [Cryptobacterium curtum DSM 15641]|uniref:Uncharacterized protein n=1 Tax=Cryptobacterium curtum (strain ATCC 700683 / DSM 15641 / CCUG 43107 / 12-3) TaxID=469378 RepID=C7MM74_CRYCD|nr:hypothetical protein Ccur_02870 [Cryptobacterium curtum DSM 15641]